jgi:hypothetical protein
MAKDEKRYTTINGNKYRVIVSESRWSKRVTVENCEVLGNNEIVGRTVYKGTIWWIGPDASRPVEELVRDVLNKAVCKREKKIEEQEYFEERISSSVEQVSEVHEE